MNSIGTSSTEAGQPSLNQPAGIGRARRMSPFPWLLPLLAVAVLGAVGAWVGFPAPVQALIPVDYDRDDDGLIEVSSLAQLNAIRWDLDGDGSASDTDSGYDSAFPYAMSGMGCPSAGCTGYELNVDLDFDTNRSGDADSGDDYWNEGSGWAPIGTYVPNDDSSNFGATFDGNGHTISGLFINRGSTNYIGLFGYIDSSSFIRRTGLLSGNVTGYYYVGGLVGQNNGATITASYASGSVTGDNYVGGLVGYNNSGPITTSHASGSVTGNISVGGLVGWNSGDITASHASASVAGNFLVGGLVGQNNGATITASYASGSVTGDNYVGGLVGYNSSGTITTASYWDTDTSGQTTSDGGIGKTTSQLQSPTRYTGIYSNWNVDIDNADGDDTPSTGRDKPWDFGTASQYPTINNVADAPKSLRAMSGDEQVTLTWATGSSILPITQYQFRGDGSGRGWQDIAGSDANTTSHTVTGLTNGQSYTFQLRAVNQAGPGEASDWVTATPLAPPNQPEGLRAMPDANSVILDWSAASADENITRYQFQGDGSGRGWQDIPGSDASTTSYTVTGLTKGQSYRFRVRAVNPVGTGPASDRVTATPQFLVTISVSDSTPLIGQRITLTADVASGIAVASYQWDRRFGDGTWREDGPPRKSKGVKFDVNRTAVYRAVATLSTGRTVRSEPVTLTWQISSRITVSNSSPARGEPVTWTAQLRGGDCSSMDYAWYQVGVDGAGSSVEDGSSDTITEMFFQAEPRTYYVEITCSDSEGNDVSYTSDRVTATATDEIWPYATITSNDDDNVVPVGTQVVLTTNLERRNPPLNWQVTWERRFGNGEWREAVDKPGSARFRRTFDGPGSRTYRSSIYIIQLDDTVKSETITVTWTE